MRPGRESLQRDVTMKKGLFPQIILAALIIFSTSPLLADDAPLTKQETTKIWQKFNNDRKVRKILPCRQDDDLDALAAKELTAMLEKPELAQTMKTRLKNEPKLKEGFTTLLFAVKNEKELMAKLVKQKNYERFLAADIAALGIAGIKLDAEPPFWQILIIGGKEVPLDPCNGQPGLSEAQVAGTKRSIESRITACYNKAIETGDPNISGKITYSLEVAPTGAIAVKNLIFASEDLKAEVLPCIEGLMKGLKFPKPCGNKPVKILSFGWDFTPPHGTSKRLGRLSNALITSAIQRKRPQMQRCYEKELKRNKKLQGKIVLHFALEPSGKIKELSLKEDSIKSPAVTTCVLQEAGKVLFQAPKYNGEVEFDFPLEFTSDAK